MESRSLFFFLFVLISLVIFGSVNSFAVETYSFQEDTCTPDDIVSCGSDVGLCKLGEKTCLSDSTWGECVDDVKPTTEVCDGFDNDCDGEIDNGVNCLCINGEKRDCGGPNIGACKFGVSYCENGQWSDCLGGIDSIQEICNDIDDNCDGIIDNVAGGNSVSNTHCQCYGGREGEKESCNGIDDDCDGNIDESSECCSIGETRECGTSLGVCERGASRCGQDRLWGECNNDVKPKQFEICGNEQDDDCDGKPDEYDEQCKACTNGEQDEFEIGVDCGGTCSIPCFEIPWIIISTATVLLVVLIIFVIYPKMQKNAVEVSGL